MLGSKAYKTIARKIGGEASEDIVKAAAKNLGYETTQKMVKPLNGMVNVDEIANVAKEMISKGVSSSTLGNVERSGAKFVEKNLANKNSVKELGSLSGMKDLLNTMESGRPVPNLSQALDSVHIGRSKNIKKQIAQQAAEEVVGKGTNSEFLRSIKSPNNTSRSTYKNSNLEQMRSYMNDTGSVSGAKSNFDNFIQSNFDNFKDVYIGNAQKAQVKANKDLMGKYPNTKEGRKNLKKKRFDDKNFYMKHKTGEQFKQLEKDMANKDFNSPLWDVFKDQGYDPKKLTQEQFDLVRAKKINEVSGKDMGLIDTLGFYRVPEKTVAVGGTAWLVSNLASSKGQQSNSQLYGQGY